MNPAVSIIVTTYNRGPLLRRQLHHLSLQDLPHDRFEVIVSDDGSSDGTAEIVESFVGRLPLQYHVQEDLGFRASTARNAGARLASAPVLVFLDAGAMPGPGLARAHLAAHEDPAAHRMVIGHGHGFGANLARLAGLAEAMDEAPLDEVARRFAGNPEFRDGREDRLAAAGYDLGRDPLPWQLFFTFNCSVRADDFRRIGGFDEAFVQWGAEDIEIAFRGARHGLTFGYAPDAWIVEWPHERPMGDRMATFTENMLQFLAKFPEPVIEVGWRAVRDVEFWSWPQFAREISEHTARVREVDVRAEIAQAAAAHGDGSLVVIGAGGDLPDLPAGTVVVEFDRQLLDRAGGDGRHAVGIRTTLADQSVETVLITSRLAGLWEHWGADLLAEAGRIGRKTELTDRLAALIEARR
ncbi:glycosyltransferase family 2 protein [Catenuloplanes sp. NPDC051500]|uniref:glycosyltransferase family 2 protein n=1 Tax=Catenuloplanes sp. NPDC051500 TaxID=3363959 RepID=UPI003795128C